MLTYIRDQEANSLSMSVLPHQSLPNTSFSLCTVQVLRNNNLNCVLSSLVSTVTDLEGMIHGQKQLMEKLTDECKQLTHKLDEATVKHK